MVSGEMSPLRWQSDPLVVQPVKINATAAMRCAECCCCRISNPGNDSCLALFLLCIVHSTLGSCSPGYPLVITDGRNLGGSQASFA